MFWVLVCIVSAIFIYVKIHKPHKYWEERDVPHEKPWPLIGNVGRIVFRRAPLVETLHNWCQKFNTRYFGFYQFLSPTLVIQDPELIKQIGIKDFEYFMDHQSFADETVDPIFGRSLFQLKGQKWRNMRSTLSPAFTSSKMKTMFISMSECSEKVTEHILKDLPPNQHKIFDMKDLFTRFGNDVIATCAFGIECNSLLEPNNQFYLMGKEVTNFDGNRGVRLFLNIASPFLTRFFKVRIIDWDIGDFFINVVKSTVQEREKKEIHRSDLINLLMEARKGKLKYYEPVSNEDEDTGFALVEESQNNNKDDSQQETEEWTYELMTAQALIFFFAGFDTTSTLMCHMAYELALNPEIQEELQIEIDDTMKLCANGKASYDAITKMKYLDMVVCESLRKWPAAVLSDRVCTKTYRIEPVHPNEKLLILNPGDRLWIPTYAIHRNPKHYPNPEKFDPERFSDENKKNINPSVYIPFGIGPRNCIGSRFALLEVKVFFFYLLSKMQLVICEKTQVPLKLSRSNMHLVAEKGFWLGLKRRNKQN